MSKTHSMTGYGRCEASAPTVHVTAEARSVNHRFAEVQVKLPREWMALEREVVSRIKERIGRGRVEVTLRRGAGEGAGRRVKLDDALVASILAEGDRIAAVSAGRIDPTLRFGELLAVPGILTVDEESVDVDAEAPAVWEALDGALAALLAMRVSEGARLEDDVRERIAEIGKLTDRVAELAAEQPELFRARLERRIRELEEEASIDEGRLLQEAATLAAKASIEEEITRLRSHVAQGGEILADDGPVGRRLEFLVQEFGREANTVGSKNDDPRLAELVIALKATIEAVREQVANIE